MTEEQAEELLWMLDNDEIGESLAAYLVRIWDRYTNTEHGAAYVIAMKHEERM